MKFYAISAHLVNLFATTVAYSSILSVNHYLHRYPCLFRRVTPVGINLNSKLKAISKAGHTDMSSESLSSPRGLLKGRRVLITGGGRGIGRAIAFICAEEGADVAVLSRTLQEVNAVAEEAKRRFGTRILPVCADVTDEGQVIKAVSEVVSQFGGIDILVNNAGAGCEKVPGHQQSVDAFRRLLDVNVVSALIVSTQVLNQCMLAQKAGSIINISSRAGKVFYALMH